MTPSPLTAARERGGRLLHVTLARPRANLVDAEMIAALRHAFATHRGGSIAGAILDAEGPHFSFGASVEEHLPENCAAMLASLHGLILEMLDWPAPITVCVRGQCLGGGLELALAGSRIVAAPDAKLGQPEIRLGVFAPAASCLLPFRVNQSDAEDLLLTGRSVDAATARTMGLVAEIAEDPVAAAYAWFDSHLAERSSSSLAQAIAAARVGYAADVRARLGVVERQYLEVLMRTNDANEGLRAFLDKRAPRWAHS